jgi:hypothetical protein
LASLKIRQSYGGVEIVEDPGRAAGQHQLGCLGAIRAEGGHDSDVRVGDIPLSALADFLPAGIEDELAWGGDLEKIAIHGVVGHVVLVEAHSMSPLGKRSHESAPEGRVAVAP